LQPVWHLPRLLAKAAEELPAVRMFVDEMAAVNMTRSYLHLHVGLDATGIDMDALAPHYTVFEKGMVRAGGGSDGAITDHVCSEGNMVAVSNVCRLEKELAPEGKIMLHAYMCANEPYEKWEGQRRGAEYEAMKDKEAEALWSAIERIIPDARERADVALVGSPLTHERFLRRPRGTYGATVESLLRDGSTPIEGLVLCGDSLFPGIGIPAVALSGASAANAFVGVREQLRAYKKEKKPPRKKVK